MTVRNFWLGAAAALAALALSGVGSAKAHVQYCDLAPDNCFFGGDGRYYYFPPGSQGAAAIAAGKYSIPAFVRATGGHPTGVVHRTAPHTHRPPSH